MATASILRLPLVSGIALAAMLTALSAYAQTKPAPTVETCRTINDKVARLECFDTVFNVSIPKTPLDPPVFPVETKPIEKGPIRTISENQERSRTADQKGWITRIRPWADNMFFSPDNFHEIKVSSANREPDGTANRHKWTDENIDVFLTQQEADDMAGQPVKRFADRALLMAACENDITSLYVVLPRPVTDPRTRLTLSSDRGTVFSVKWRDVEQGNVIAAGRGLESIDFIKSLTSFKRIQLQIQDDQESRAFTFDIEDLNARLAPLRTACHW